MSDCPAKIFITGLPVFWNEVLFSRSLVPANFCHWGCIWVFALFKQMIWGGEIAFFHSQIWKDSTFGATLCDKNPQYCRFQILWWLHLDAYIFPCYVLHFYKIQKMIMFWLFFSPIVNFLSFPLFLSPCLFPIFFVPVFLLQQEIEGEMAEIYCISPMCVFFFFNFWICILFSCNEAGTFLWKLSEPSAAVIERLGPSKWCLRFLFVRNTENKV